MARILITGASGFIGSHIVEESLALGHEVWAAVRPASSRAFLTDPRIHFITLDLGDPDLLRAQLAAAPFATQTYTTQLASPTSTQPTPTASATPFYVIHAAGATKCLHRDDFFRNNLDATRNLVEALLALNLRPTRFIFLSSLSLFGAIRETPISPTAPLYPEITAADTPHPNTAYGESKLRAEQYLRTVPGLHYVILRPTGVYGPRERDYFIMAQSIRRHIDFAVGSTPQEITFVYVRDLVQAIMKSLTAPGVERHAFFISDGQTYNSRAFSDLLRAELGNPWLLRICAPLWFLRAVCAVNGTICRLLGKTTTLNTDKYHILAQRNWRCDITPAIRLLGYTPQYSLGQGVKETVAWYKAHHWL